MLTQQQIQDAILDIARRGPFHLEMIRHLGTQDQLMRARRQLKQSGKIVVVGNKTVNSARYEVYALPQDVEKPKVVKATKWGCGTPKSTGNAFDWQGPSTLYSRKEQVDARTAWKRGAGIAI